MFGHTHIGLTIQLAVYKQVYHLACIIQRSIPFSLQYTDTYTIHFVVYRQEHHPVGSMYTDMYAVCSSVRRQVSHWLGCIQTSVIHLAVHGLVYHSVSSIKMSLPYSCCIWTGMLCSCYYTEKYTIKLIVYRLAYHSAVNIQTSVSVTLWTSMPFN